MADLHPLVIVLLAIIGSIAAMAVGCAIHRVLRPEEFSKAHLRNFSQEQQNFMREVCERTRADAFADSGRVQGMGRSTPGGGYFPPYNDGYSGAGFSAHSRV
jgi:hypothetical protein